MAQQLLAVRVRRGRRFPDGRQVGRERPDLLPLGGGQGTGPGSEVAVVVLAEPLPPGQGVVPVFLQLPRDQPVFRLGELVLAAGAVSCVVSALQPLPPDAVGLGALAFFLLCGSKGDFQRGRGHRLQRQPGHVVVDACAGQLLAALASPGDGGHAAHVGRLQGAAGAALVADGHLHPAAAAADQPGQQGRAVAHRAHALGAGPVRVHPPHVPLVLLHADV